MWTKRRVYKRPISAKHFASFVLHFIVIMAARAKCFRESRIMVEGNALFQGKVYRENSHGVHDSHNSGSHTSILSNTDPIPKYVSADKEDPASAHEAAANGSASSSLVELSTMTPFASRVPGYDQVLHSDSLQNEVLLRPRGNPPVGEKPIITSPQNRYSAFSGDMESRVTSQKRKYTRGFSHLEYHFIAAARDNTWVNAASAAHEADMKALEIVLNTKRRRRKEREQSLVWWEDSTMTDAGSDGTCLGFENTFGLMKTRQVWLPSRSMSWLHRDRETGHRILDPEPDSRDESCC